jgi:hypothetical protein
MIIGSPSKAPDIVDALNDLVTGALVFAGLQVIDGPILDLEDLANDAICIGAGNTSDPGFTSSFEVDTSLGRKAYTETVFINVTISARIVDDYDMRARRQRVKELLADLQGLLTDNRVNDGTWDDIGVGPEGVWHQVVTVRGAVCALGVLVEARALI